MSYAAVAMITLPSFGAETDLEIQLVTDTVLVTIKVLLLFFPYVQPSSCNIFLSYVSLLKFPGYGDQNLLSGRMMSGFPVSEPPPTPGPFAPGLSRNEGTIPGIGVAMPLSAQSLDGSDQGEQRPAIPGLLPPGAPPLPPGPHPSLLASGQQQAYQQYQPQQHQQQQQPPSFPQQVVQLPLPPSNMNQMQPPPHLQLLPHPHMPRPPPGQPPQVQQLGMPGSVPSLPGSMPMSMQNPMVILCHITCTSVKRDLWI